MVAFVAWSIAFLVPNCLETLSDHTFGSVLVPKCLVTNKHTHLRPAVTNHSLQFVSRYDYALIVVLETCMQVLVLASIISF